jgi:hypothetical protein
MGEDALPRPVAKYLNGLPPERQEKIRALIYEVHQALKKGADTEQIIELLADNLLLKPEDELAMLEFQIGSAAGGVTASRPRAPAR